MQHFVCTNGNLSFTGQGQRLALQPSLQMCVASALQAPSFRPLGPASYWAFPQNSRHTSFYCASRVLGFFTKWRQDTPPAKRLRLALSGWSGTRPTISLRYACSICLKLNMPKIKYRFTPHWLYYSPDGTVSKTEEMKIVRGRAINLVCCHLGYETICNYLYDYICLEQESANFLCKGLDSKYFQLPWPYRLHCTHSILSL